MGVLRALAMITRAKERKSGTKRVDGAEEEESWRRREEKREKKREGGRGDRLRYTTTRVSG